MVNYIIILVALVALTTGLVVKNTSKSSVKNTTGFQGPKDGTGVVKTKSIEINQSGDEDHSENELANDSGSEESGSKVNWADKPTTDELSEETLIEKNAEEDLKSWIKNLDCYKTWMGIMKCMIVKSVHEEYYSNPNRDTATMKNAIKYLVKSIQGDKNVDPELAVLINKYGDYLNKD